LKLRKTQEGGVEFCWLLTVSFSLVFVKTWSVSDVVDSTSESDATENITQI